MQGNGEKMPQPSIDNYLIFLLFFFFAGWFEYQYWRWIQIFLWCFQPVWEPRKHGHYLFHQSVFLWKAGGRESRGKEQTSRCKVPSVVVPAAVLSRQVFASRLCISRQNRSHASCQGDGYHRYKITQPLKWPCHRILLKICYICYFSFKSQFLRRCKYIKLLFLPILWVFWEAKES